MICEEEVKKWLSIFEKSSVESISSEKDARAFDSLDGLVSFLNQLKEFIEQKVLLIIILLFSSGLFVK